MLHFRIDEQKCTRCGLCARDCPVGVIDMRSDTPSITPKKEAICLRCQHCLAICPTAALSILGQNPEENSPLKGKLPDPQRLETLIRGRRSVRYYRDENLEPDLMQRLLDVAWQVPTGANARQVRFTVLDDRQVTHQFREELYTGLADLARKGSLPKNRRFFARFVRTWEERGVDLIFRGAPHLLVASAPRGCPTPIPDCLIALSFFDLFAQSLGVGTVWDGYVLWALELLPQARMRLALPDDHVIGYVMAFGYPAVSYLRTVDHGSAEVVRIASAP